MKMTYKNLALLVGMMQWGLLAVGGQALGVDHPRELKEFRKANPMEMAPMAARLIRQAPVTERRELGLQLISLTAKERPVSVLNLVAALAAAEPDLAADYTAHATALMPSYGEAIVKAALSAAPQKAPAIAASSAVALGRSRTGQSLSRTAHDTKPTPKVEAEWNQSAWRVAELAVREQPAQSAEILNAVESAVPSAQGELKTLVRMGPKGNKEDKRGIGNGKGKGIENGTGVGKGKGLGQGIGNGKGRGHINGRGVLKPRQYGHLNP